MIRLDTLKLNTFFEIDGELLELVNKNYLDVIAEAFDHKTKKIITLGLFVYVTPVEVKIEKISTGDTFPVCIHNDEEYFWQNAADNLIRSAPILKSAAETLRDLGYTYHGGTQWRPPVRKREDI